MDDKNNVNIELEDIGESSNPNNNNINTPNSDNHNKKDNNINSINQKKKSKWGVRNKLRLVNQKGSSFPGGLVRYRGKKATTDLVIESSGEVVEVDKDEKAYEPTATKVQFYEVFKLFLGLDELKSTALYKSAMIEFLGTTVFTYISIGIVIATVNYYNFSVPYHDPPSPGLVPHPGQSIVLAIAHILLFLIVLISISPGSGGILNCTITLATILTGYTTLSKGIIYIIVQILGSIVGAAMMYASLPYEIVARTKLGVCDYGNNYSAGNALVTEYMLSIFNLMVVFGAALDPRQAQQFGNLTPLVLAAFTLGISIYMPAGLGFQAAPGFSINRCLSSALVFGHWNSKYQQQQQQPFFTTAKATSPSFNSNYINKKKMQQREEAESESSSAAALKNIEELDEKHRLSITTFNILAPCYEKSTEHSYSRQEDIIKTLLSLNSDIINLQEFYFNEEFESLYTTRLAAKYNSIALKRTNQKKDGLAIFIKRSYQIITKKPLRFNDQGDRVALFLHIKSDIGAEFIIVNTHLTFPHNQFDEEVLRLSQIQSVQASIDSYVRQLNVGYELPVLICGDFNSPNGLIDKCVVYQFLKTNQYLSTFNILHPETKHFVSHKNHLQQEVGVDFIYLRDHQLYNYLSNSNNNNNNNNNKQTEQEQEQQPTPENSQLLKGSHIYPIDSYFFPRELSPQKWYQDMKLSDHRPLTTTFKIIYNNES
ncbi:hypothetical protein PPL_05741 [Heterostelium album PN500]|uniref:Endonuclease/exonuclease/phosphatase domain-containing protein n=1 Tax=Heterostelium pallidum (strain ATCC 26659 / Pp 5 / PN500) TaxID=670386 RepID=D3BB10_HETP5|nr:hypothetical protein PPL_05741 [Heterostelium album PN500]EFA81747.1 hypothetical protein PPL_05741 [Heterostelium album PN500]|eukprot:XP_020433864.1 hypothetical protein PPL_05741 [Heterostelium album PN500]